MALALAVYQVVLISVGYGKLRPSFLDPPPAFAAHRAVGDTIVVVLVVVALMCIGWFGLEDDATLHIVAAIALLSVLALKIVVVRRWHAMGRFLPALGISVWLRCRPRRAAPSPSANAAAAPERRQQLARHRTLQSIGAPRLERGHALARHKSEPAGRSSVPTQPALR